MSKYIPGNQKHLTLEDRIYIENELNKGTSFKDIARFLCKDPTTISKEVRAHRLSDWYHKGTFYNAKNFCVHRYHCRKTNACGKIVLCGIKCTSCPTCNQTCKDFVKERCSRLDRAPYVCNGCDKKITHCTIAHKYSYNARFADRKYREKLRDSRAGINMAMRRVEESVVNQGWITLQEAGINLDRNTLAAMLIRELRAALELFEQEGLAPYLSRWEKLDNFINRPVKLIIGDKEIFGISRGIDKQGALLLEQDGIIKPWMGGEISLRSAEK